MFNYFSHIVPRYSHFIVTRIFTIDWILFFSGFHWQYTKYSPIHGTGDALVYFDAPSFERYVSSVKKPNSFTSKNIFIVLIAIPMTILLVCDLVELNSKSNFLEQADLQHLNLTEDHTIHHSQRDLDITHWEDRHWDNHKGIHLAESRKIYKNKSSARSQHRMYIARKQHQNPTYRNNQQFCSTLRHTTSEDITCHHFISPSDNLPCPKSYSAIFSLRKGKDVSQLYVEINSDNLNIYQEVVNLALIMAERTKFRSRFSENFPHTTALATALSEHFFYPEVQESKGLCELFRSNAQVNDEVSLTPKTQSKYDMESAFKMATLALLALAGCFPLYKLYVKCNTQKKNRRPPIPRPSTVDHETTSFDEKVKKTPEIAIQSSPLSIGTPKLERKSSKIPTREKEIRQKDKVQEKPKERVNEKPKKERKPSQDFSKKNKLKELLTPVISGQGIGKTDSKHQELLYDENMDESVIDEGGDICYISQSTLIDASEFFPVSSSEVTYRIPIKVEDIHTEILESPGLLSGNLEQHVRSPSSVFINTTLSPRPPIGHRRHHSGDAGRHQFESLTRQGKVLLKRDNFSWDGGLNIRKFDRDDEKHEEDRVLGLGLNYSEAFENDNLRSESKLKEEELEFSNEENHQPSDFRKLWKSKATSHQKIPSLGQQELAELKESFEKHFWIKPPEVDIPKTRTIFCFNCGEQGHEGKLCTKPKYEECMQSPSMLYI